MLCDQALREARRQERLARRHDLDAVDEPVDRARLQHEPGRAGPQGLVDVLVQVVGREDQHPGTQAGRDDLPRGRDAVHHRHADVHQEHVRQLARRALDRGGAVSGLTRDLDTARLEQGAEAAADEVLVVCDDDGGHAASGTAGSRAASRKPPSAVAAAASTPP